MQYIYQISPDCDADAVSTMYIEKSILIVTPEMITRHNSQQNIRINDNKQLDQITQKSRGDCKISRFINKT